MGFAAVSLTALTANSSIAVDAPDPTATAARVPADGQAYFGVQMDWKVDTPARYGQRLGRTPAVFGKFVTFPFTNASRNELTTEAAMIGAAHGILFVTLEPTGGLNTVNKGALVDLTKQLKAWNAKGAPVAVRFAHEMNGPWYSWGQQPTNYIRVFRTVADTVHGVAGNAIVWSPNDGSGYPFAGGAYEAKPGTVDFAVLDTNHDGVLSISDDPYAPYYPGDAYVDWVGLSLYHFGYKWPWGENEVPEADKFVNKITGNYNGPVDDTALPNFYDAFAVGHNKPMAISETSALFNTGRSDGAGNFDIKSAWWSQLFSDTVATQFPKIKMFNWFEYIKQENDVSEGPVDWRVTYDPAIRDGFKAAIPSRFIFATR